MKKRFLAMLLAMVMVAAMAGGCGKTETPDEAPVVETEAEVPEAVEEELPAPEYEEAYYTVVVGSETEEGGAYVAHDAENAYVVSVSAEMPENQKALFAEDAVLKLTTLEEVTGDEAADDASTEDVIDEDASDNEGEDADAAADAEATETAEDENSTGAPFTYGDPVAITAVAAETVEEMEGFELSQTVFGNLNGYTVEDIAETQMYAKSSVNVRSGPSTDYDVLGQLSFAQEVTSNGITSTNWHRIKYNDGEAYVASSYLVTEKPVKQTASLGGSGTSGGSTDNGSSGAASSDYAAAMRALKAEYDAATAAGDYARADELFAQLTGGLPEGYIGGGSNSGGAVASSGDSSSSNSTEVTTSLSQDFVNYLNSQRAAQGLSEVSWSDSMASTALERAVEIVSNFSHDGYRNCSGEIIQTNTSSDVSSWYNLFEGSNGHKMWMLSPAVKSAAAAYVKSGGYYYVAVLLSY